MHDPAEILRLEEAVWQAVIDKRGDSLAEKFADDYLEITVDPQDRWVTSIWRKDDAGAWKCVLFQQTGREA